MCRESDKWLSTHFHAHIGHLAHCKITWTHQTVGSLHVYLVHVNGQRPVCLTCSCKYAESQTIGLLHIFMHTSVIGLTAQLHEHIRQSDHCTFTCTHQVHVNVQWPVCLTCASKCAESLTIGSLHIFMHTSVIGLTAQLYEHIRKSDHCTFTCTHQVHVKVQWPEYLTCACKCAESHTLVSLHNSCTFPSHGSPPIYMSTLDSRISARSHAHIRCM